MVQARTGDAFDDLLFGGGVRIFKLYALPSSNSIVYNLFPMIIWATKGAHLKFRREELPPTVVTYLAGKQLAATLAGAEENVGNENSNQPWSRRSPIVGGGGD